jgi:hypothetical protein
VTHDFTDRLLRELIIATESDELDNFDGDWLLITHARTDFLNVNHCTFTGGFGSVGDALEAAEKALAALRASDPDTDWVAHTMPLWPPSSMDKTVDETPDSV